MDKYTPRLSKRQKLGYGAGSAADTMTYDFVLAFFMFFMTVVAGIDIRIAGAIIAIATIWDIFTDPWVGSLCDKTYAKNGTRRPWIIISAFPLAISLVLMFSIFEMSDVCKNIYYLVISFLFWISYTSFSIPYYAIGASITDNIDERTVLRSFCQICQYAGVFLAGALPNSLVAFLMDRGTERDAAWQQVVIFLAILIVCVIICVFFSIKNTELDFSHNKAEYENDNFPLIKSVPLNFFENISDIWTISAFRWITIVAFFYQIGYAISMGTVVYAIFFIGNMSEGDASIIYGFVAFSGIVIAAIMGKIATKRDKRTISICCLVTSGCSMCALKFIDYGSLQGFLFVGLLYSIGSVTYWTLIYAMLYDVIEVDEFKNGKRREGLMFSFFSFCQKLSYAIATASITFILAAAGFTKGSLIQTDEVIKAIDTIFTILPGCFILICAFSLFMFPVSRPLYQKMMVQLRLKRQGKEYNTIGFEKLLK